MKAQLIRRSSALLGLGVFFVALLPAGASAALPAGATLPGSPPGPTAELLPGLAGGSLDDPLARPLQGRDLHLSEVDLEPAAGESTVIPGHYIVVFKDSVDRPVKVARNQVEQRDGELGFLYRSAIKGYSAELSKSDVEALRKDPRVKFVAPDHEVKVAAQTTPEGLKRIFAAANSKLDIDGADELRVDADVAVIDSGIDHEHPDLNVVGRTNCVPPGEDFATEWSIEECKDESGADGHGHGTHVAGTIAALDNDKGVVGVAPGARLWAARAMNKEGSGSESWIAAAVDWVTATREDEDPKNDIEVANMSLGCQCAMPALDAAIKASAEAGVVYVLAAGNDDIDTKNYSPAGQPNSITVSALADSDGKPGSEGFACVSKDDTLASFSNFGTEVDVAAPGTCVYSTLPERGYGTLNGTSMAAPHVAGAAAILASQSNPEDLEGVEAIQETIEEEGNSEWEDTSGDGVKEPLLDVGSEAAFSPPGRPVTQPASIQSETKATLHGTLNPEGIPTTYQFEYGTSTAYGSKVPASPKSVGSGSSFVSVNEAIESLKGQTLYHYRIVATNSKGSFYGNDATFATTAPAMAIEEPEVNANDATLKAKINPEGIPTTYQFEYGTTSSYGMTPPSPPKSAGSSTANVEVSEEIGFLTGDKIYHYRLRVTNATGTFYTEGETFETQPTDWSVQGTPVEEGVSHALYDVSCSSQDDCMAVGQRFANPPGSLLAERWDGEEWSAAPAPDSPEKATSELLESVSCTSPTWCVATGRYTTGEVHPFFIEHWDGSSWSTAWTSESKGEIFLSDVSCSSPSSCIAVAIESDSGKSKALAVIWDGKKWTTQYIPEPEGAYSMSPLSASVSCTSPVSCVFAAGWVTSAGAYHPLVEQWDGQDWAIIQDTEPVEHSFYYLRSIGCGSESSCLAPVLGGSEVERWDGEDWTSEAVPQVPGVPPGWVVSALSIDCATATACAVAARKRRPISTYHMAGEIYAPYVAMWSGEEWLLQSAQNPTQETEPNDIEAELRSVSCPSPTSCVAVGSHYTGGYRRSMAEHYQAPGPLSKTDPATAVTPDSATLNASVDPEGASTIYQFEYGTTAEYGNEIPASPQSIGSGSEAVEVDEALEGLKPSTTYHFRVVASNENGTTYGEDRTFLTLPKLSTRWTLDGQPIEEDQIIEGWGEVIFGWGGPNGYICELGFWGEIFPGHKAEGEAEEFFLESCNGAGVYTTCEIELEEVDMPMSIRATKSNEIKLYDFDLVLEFSNKGEQKCWEGSAGLWHFYDAEVTFDPDDPEAISTADLTLSAEKVVKGSDCCVFEYNTLQGDAEVFSTGELGIEQIEGFEWPIATTQAATVQSTEDATLTTTVNPNGLATTYQFEYGKTASYGTKAPIPAKGIGSGFKAIEAKETLEGLQPGTTYHFRVTATNEDGTVHGEGRTFTTHEVPPAFGFASGSEGTGAGEFKFPIAISADAQGDVWVADTLNHRIQKLGPEGQFLAEAGVEGAGNGQFKSPQGIDVDPEGDVWVADTLNHRIQKLDPEGEYLAQLGSQGTGNGQFKEPASIAVDPEGDIWVADIGNHRIQKFSSGGEYLTQFGSNGTGDGQFKSPRDLAVDEEGNVWVADIGNHRIQKFDSQGEYLAQFSTKETLTQPRGIAIDAEGSVWVTDSGGFAKFSPQGDFLTQYAWDGSGEPEFKLPVGIDIDPENGIWIADTVNHRVQRWAYSPAPRAYTRGASELSATEFELEAALIPNGSPTTYQFEYGTTTAYGSKAPISAKAIGSGYETIEMGEAIEGLQPETTYHYRVVASNEDGTAFGHDRSFTTVQE